MLTKRPLGQVLVDGEFISSEELENALEQQKHTNELLGEVLVRMGHLTESELNAVLSFQQNQGNKASLSVRFRIGEILVATNIISRDQLEETLF